MSPHTRLECSSCTATRKSTPTKDGTPRVNPPWKRLPDGSVICGVCKAARYGQPRAVEFPVAGMEGGTLAELGALADRLFEQAWALSNFAVTKLMEHDPPRPPGQPSLGPKPKVDLYAIYKDSKTMFPDIGGSSAAAIVQGVLRRWNALRGSVRWSGRKSAPSYRYPQPVPFPADEWVRENKKGEVVTCGVGWERVNEDGSKWRVNWPYVDLFFCGERRRLRLRGGPEFSRQLAGFRQILSGEAVPGQAVLYRRGDGKPLLLKMVAYFPRRERAPGEHTMLVRTDPNAFWVAEQEGHPPWIVNADHVRRWQAEHRTFLQRFAEDMKREKRWPKRKRLRMNGARARRCDKNRSRLETWSHQVTASLARLAAARRVGEVIYDDSPRGFLESFPWHELKVKLAYKLEGLGIRFSGCLDERKDGV